MSVADKIKEQLEAGLNISNLEIINQSHLHAGHSGDDGSGESHFKLVIISDSFEGVGRIGRRKMVHAALGEILMGQIHAIAMTVKTPSE